MVRFSPWKLRGANTVPGYAPPSKPRHQCNDQEAGNSRVDSGLYWCPAPNDRCQPSRQGEKSAPQDRQQAPPRPPEDQSNGKRHPECAVANRRPRGEGLKRCSGGAHVAGPVHETQRAGRDREEGGGEAPEGARQRSTQSAR